MSRTSFLYAIIIFSSILSLKAPDAALAPQAPIAVISSGAIQYPVVVGSNAQGFMTSAVASAHLQPKFSSNNGTSWGALPAIFENAYLPVWISGNKDGFMATWIGDDIGPANGSPFWSFSEDNGATWTTAALITAANAIYSPSVVTSNSKGFVVAWRNGSNNDAYVSFTSNKGATWSTPVNISNSGIIDNAVQVCATEAGFMATWATNGNQAYASFSSNGTTWSAPSTIVGTATVMSDMWVAGNSTGFMATWSNNNNEAWSSFSSDNGQTWSTAVQIATGVLYNVYPTNVSVAACPAGFVAAWIGNNNHAYASFSTGGNAPTWSSPVQVSTTNNVAMGLTSGNGCAFVGISAQADSCVFAWLTSGGNVYSSTSRIGPVRPVSTLSVSQKKNDFGLLYEFYNLLQWQLSTSTDVAGYYIYRDNTLIATTTPSTTCYKDHNQPCNPNVRYAIKTFDSAGNTSPKAIVTFNNGSSSTVTLE